MAKAAHHLEILRLVEELYEGIQVHCDSRAGTTETDVVFVSVTRDIPPCSLLSMARMSKADCKFYWRDRKGEFEAVGLGAAETYVADLSQDPRQQVRRLLRYLEQSDVSARIFGGLRFDTIDGAMDSSEEWRRFYGGLFILPLVEISRQGDDYKLTVTVKRRLSQPASPFEHFGYSNAYSDDSDERSWSPAGRCEIPSRNDWSNGIDRVSRMIRSHAISKVVLARRVSFDCGRSVNPFDLLARAFESDESATLFGFQPSACIGFIGGTPELLVNRNQKHFYSEAVAGTRRVSVEGDGSTQFDETLCWNPKHRREVDLVRDAITEKLTALCAAIKSPDEPEIHRAGKVDHLRFPISGLLKEDISTADLVTALCPTPAVCGTPTERAIELIRELEPFDRGWYAGPVGWISRDAAEFAVAIRSALVNGNTVHLYSGAGIVEGSEAAAEWDELDAKIATLKAALGA